jgi:hypothetical protein
MYKILVTSYNMKKTEIDVKLVPARCWRLLGSGAQGIIVE